MSKNNPPLPPALEHDGRLINSVVGSRKCKRPNALKHGVFAETPLIPGEDPREFAQLYVELIDEWQPSGPTLRFALRGLADLMWRMHRLKKFVQTKLSLTTFDPRNPSFSFPAELKFDAPELGDRADELLEASRQWEAEQKVAGCTSYASEILEYDFKETERLEARIAKQTRYCAELKAMEETRSRT